MPSPQVLTAGGTSDYGDVFYRDKYCTPFAEGYTGPERVYLIELPTVSD